ncbi:alpha/beta-hydrolase [Lophiostoma macrostomum CBS 122681]|uniref:Alpha/beta-hydrolase n=1 Tax=Lophiostoma macrostomum CBS 122681 TaxID=1314788 RepID=A0A6A6T0U0_9PLEO|nr:alpha/beta-hydrolase [Lophiostoma macrostomum CBS 122681]
MAPTRSTIVIIHGGWGTPGTYFKLTDALKSAGYEVHLPPLPSMNGSRPPNAGLDADTNVVRSCVEALLNEGKNVIAVMHSYGGQVGTNALYDLSVDTRSKNKLPGGVTDLVYLTAYAVLKGRAMMDTVQEFGHMHFVPLVFDFADDDSCVHRDPITYIVGPGAEETEVEKFVSTMQRWNGGAMKEPLTHCAWKEKVPVSYIYTTQDATVPYDYQKSFVEGMEAQGKEVRTFELETGHSPQFTKTKEMVDIINEIAST